MNINVPA